MILEWKGEIYDPYTLEFSKYNNDIVDALVEVYGDEFSSLIDKRFELIYFVPYVNYEGINSYYRFLKARLKGNFTCLTDYVGEENFDELNDIIDYTDLLIEKGLADKLREQKNDDEIVIDYHKQLLRLKDVLRKINEFYEKSSSLYDEYIFRKEKQEIINR